MTLEFERAIREDQRKEAERRYVELLVRQGIDFATGVPCGVQKYIIESLSSRSEVTYVPATRESEAIGIAAGAYLAGKRPVVYMQNSGLLECINDISSLLLSYKIPALLSVSWRGAPGEDAPQHFINGMATSLILNDIGVSNFILKSEDQEIIVKKACLEMRTTGKPVAILIRRGEF